MPFPTDKTDQS